jgi:lipopolysaccharide/colanic/teichoic acid biosynthesis glycosyltransferase
MGAHCPSLWDVGQRTDPKGERSGVLKRSTDVIVAGLGLVVLAVPLLVIAVLVVIDSPGPVFYRAERVGHRGRRLRMLKFRKMREDATGGALTLAEDERLTRLGKWLARTKLDELPQLWHVLRGEMSLVGPRPESPSFVAHFPAEYAVILQVRPGLTGFTQLAFAREGAILDPDDPQAHYLTGLLPQKVALDELYASGPSFRRDLEIIAATIITLLGQPVSVNRRTGALTLRRRAKASRPATAPIPARERDDDADRHAAQAGRSAGAAHRRSA